MHDQIKATMAEPFLDREFLVLLIATSQLPCLLLFRPPHNFLIPKLAILFLNLTHCCSLALNGWTLQGKYLLFVL